MKRLLRVRVLLLTLIACSSVIGADAKDKECDYKPATAQLRRAWLELYKLPTDSKRDVDKQNLRSALGDLYRAQGNDLEANFIETSTDNDFAEQVDRIETGSAVSFPSIQKPNRYNVTKQKSGTLTFVPLAGCTGAYSIPPRSAHYQDACKHVGEINVGDTKPVPEPGFEKWLTSNERVVMPDVE